MSQRRQRPVKKLGIAGALRLAAVALGSFALVFVALALWSPRLRDALSSSAARLGESVSSQRAQVSGAIPRPPAYSASRAGEL